MNPSSQKRRGAGEWSDLQPHLLRLISSSLTSTWDYVRFRGVCSSWRSAAIPAVHRPQVPSLLLPYDLATTVRSFFDPSDRRVHTIHLPEARGKWIYGTPHGWLVMLGMQELADGCLLNVSLLNPITRAHILLPPLPREITTLPDHPFPCCTKPVLTASPAPDVLLALLMAARLAIFRLGVGGTWTVISLDVHHPMLDLAYLHGSFYAVDCSKGITVVCSKSLNKQYLAPPPDSGPISDSSTLLLLESAGDLLLLESSEPTIQVCKLDTSNSNSNLRTLNWVRVNGSIGGRALFVSESCSSISQPALEEFMGSWGSDTVCFARAARNYDQKLGGPYVASVCISNIVDASSTWHPYWERLCGAPTSWGKSLIGLTWILPNLQHIDYSGALSLAMNQVPNASSLGDSIRGVECPDLPTDVLKFISQKLASTWDYVRFRGVCSLWRSAANPGYRLPPQVPSLILPYDIGVTTRSFLDISTCQVHTINIPESRGKWLYGTPYGWLVMLGVEGNDNAWIFSVSLLNPITRAQILLPPLPKEIIRLPEQQSRRKYPYSTKPLLTGNPVSSQGSSVVLLALMIFSKLVVYRLVGGEAWSVIDLGVSSAPRRIMAEFIYFEGAFYVIDIFKGVTIVSINSLKKKYSAPPSTIPISDYHTLHMVEAATELFLLELYKKDGRYLIEVEKLDRSSKKLKWVKVKKNMSGCTMFVSHNHSSISLCPRNFTGCGRGLVLFASDDYTYDDKLRYVNIANVRMLDIVSGISHGREQYHWQGSSRQPTYEKNLIGLTWIIPSPC